MKKMNNTIYDDIKDFMKTLCSGNVQETDAEKDARKENQDAAYWCLQNEKQEDTYPRQRILARLIRSYQNTTWHKVQLKEIQQEIDSWFDGAKIISHVQKWVKVNRESVFRTFCATALKIVDGLNTGELKIGYRPNEEQKQNFMALSKVVENLFEEYCKEQNQKGLPKNQKVSPFEMDFYENLVNPYKTIMKMQKLLPGFGVALTCDFLKEAHLCNIAKPDVHLCRAFSVMDGIPYSMDLALVKRVAEFAEKFCPAKPDDFCNSGSYYIDKIIWMRLNKKKKNPSATAED